MKRILVIYITIIAITILMQAFMSNEIRFWLWEDSVKSFLMYMLLMGIILTTIIEVLLQMLVDKY